MRKLSVTISNKRYTKVLSPFEFDRFREALRALGFTATERDESEWVLGRYVTNIEKFSKHLSGLLGVSEKELFSLVAENNDKLVGNLKEEVLLTKRLLPVRYLSLDEFMLLMKYAEKVEGYYEFSQEKFVNRSDVVQLNDKADVERIIRSWLEELKKVPIVFDEDYILSDIDNIWAKVEEAKTIKATLVHHKDKAWIKLTVHNPTVVSELANLRDVPFYVESFEGGEKKLIKKTISAILIEDNAVYVAPFLMNDVKRGLEGKGYRVAADFLPISKAFEVPMKEVINLLRPYQLEALQKWIQNGYRGVIQIPTGGGKTHIGLAAISHLKVPTVVFVPTINLAFQWRDFIKKYLGIGEYYVGILGGGYNQIGKFILISTYESGVKHVLEISRKYPFYIFDEGHHVAAATFKEIAWHSLAPFRMVLSATIERDDKNEELIYAMCGRLVYSISYHKLVAEGFLAPVVIRFIGVELPDGSKGEYYRLSELLNEVRGRLRELYRRYFSIALEKGFEDVGEYLRRINHPEYISLNSQALKIKQELRLMEQGNPNKVSVAVEIARLHIHEHNMFIFTNLEKQAEVIHALLKKEYGPAVGLITGRTTPSEREKIFRLFKDGRIKCIVTTTVLDEGIDAPESDVAIVVSSRAIKHPRQFIQRIGRIVRPSEDKVGYVYILRTIGGIEEDTLDKLKVKLEETYGTPVEVITNFQPESLM